jgi:hypothetical protein
MKNTVLFVIALLLGSQQVIASERVKCNWDAKTSLLITDAKSSPGIEKPRLWTIYEFPKNGGVTVIDADGSPEEVQEEKDLHKSMTWVSEGEQRIGTGTFNSDGFKFGVTLIVGPKKALGVIGTIVADTTIYGGIEASCAILK